MKVVLVDNLKSNIDNLYIRWYLSSQQVWIAKEKNYKEIEESIGKSYGSFRWLFSDADTILFDKENLKLISSIVKVNEPIDITERKLGFINSREGTIKLVEANNYNCEVGDCTIYYSNEDTLVSCKGTLNLDDQTIAVEITTDFSFIVKDDELAGWILKNSSRYIIRDEMKCIDSGAQDIDYIKSILVKYLNLINSLSQELTSDEEEKLKNDFKVLYEFIKASTLTPIVAIKENILKVLDFM